MAKLLLDAYGAGAGDVSFMALLQDHGAPDESQAPGSPSTALYWPEVGQSASEADEQGARALRSPIAQPPTLPQQSASHKDHIEAIFPRSFVLHIIYLKLVV